MENLSLRELAVPIIKAIDSFNYLLKSHHRRVSVIAYHIGRELGLSEMDLFELVIASALHDIGALSVQERDMLVREDVINPDPHCLMGQKMLASFSYFDRIARILRYHHIKYEESLEHTDEDIPFLSHIIHLSDRVDIYISPDDFILNQKALIIGNIEEKTGTVFHPDVFHAFARVAKSDIFWIEINNLEMDSLFRKFPFSLNFDLTVDNILDFAMTLSRIIDFRSRFTSSHSYSVAHLASLIGGYLGYSDEKRHKLMIAGFLHDIGKIGVDPGLLEKDGPLTDEEFNLMKLHAYYTGQILNELNTSEWFSEIVLWAERHHERVDGSGYPYALEGDSLDDGVKIIAFSDVISALTEDRPYRNGLSRDDVFILLEERIAPLISQEIFAQIKPHREEIYKLVKECQTLTYEEYSLKLS